MGLDLSWSSFPLDTEALVIASVALLASGALYIRSLNAKRNAARTKGDGLPFPPGPKPLPLIGNAFDMPLNQPWETFTQWGKEYGEVVHVHVFDQSIIIVNTAKAANDLFEKRSSIYSDRPRLPLLGELTGFDWVFALMVYGDLWKKYRKLFISKFGPGTVQMFNPAQDYASTKLLELLLDRPEEFEDHVRLHIVQQILMSVYGFAPDSRNDDFVVLAERALNAISDLARPGAFLVDAFPFLKKIPSWVPGQFYHKMAEQLKNDVQGMRDVPILETKDMMANGTLPVPCYVSELLEKQEREKSEKFDPELENIIRDTGTIAYGAGSDTCVAALNAFFLAMALNPEVQRKAQAEIDSVIGAARLPTQTDRKDLPYTTAVMKELLRWHVIAPQSLPHMLKEDDVYEGYYLPKGAIVLGNTWGILHDPEVYPEPMEFKPERYINAAGVLDCSRNDPSKFAFGYGRRYCPAFYYTEDALHLALARILATFDIGLAKDKNGAVIPSVHLPTSGIISHPTSFKCSIVPRSQEAVALIRQANVNIKHSFKS